MKIIYGLSNSNAPTGSKPFQCSFSSSYAADERNSTDVSIMQVQPIMRPVFMPAIFCLNAPKYARLHLDPLGELMRSPRLPSRNVKGGLHLREGGRGLPIRRTGGEMGQKVR